MAARTERADDDGEERSVGRGGRGVAATAVLSSLLFEEVFTSPMVLGLALIIGGVVLIEVGSHPPGRDAEAA